MKNAKAHRSKGHLIDLREGRLQLQERRSKAGARRIPGLGTLERDHIDASRTHFDSDAGSGIALGPRLQTC
jgi:hypothetical protein